MTHRHDAAESRQDTGAQDLAEDRVEGPGSMVPLFLAASVALLLLVLLVPAVAVVGALLGFMAAAHLG